MKILVGLKRVSDPYTPIRVVSGKGEQGRVDVDHIKQVINPFCEIALEQALLLKDAGLADEVIVLSIGESKSQETLRAGLAMGADRAILLEDERRFEPLLVAKVFRAMATEHDCQLVILGKQSIDTDNGQVAPMLSALLGWSQATCLASLNVKGNNLDVIEEADLGERHLTVPLPAVLSADLRLNQPRFATLPNIMQARSKPLAVISLSALGLPYHTSAQRIAIMAPPQRQAAEQLANIEDLIDKINSLREGL
ncbi:electron transfer flavoprotein subunit beta/FixA family protein [Thaumasiovibrio sp. DFM-14]|uniref:electron transfer flavoprotein subunit beta/FixA family protein n=1 Tax=Thaumasiovibrio sp. DFM-14 TaxID=3384792 RepID=UPI0039A384F3